MNTKDTRHRLQLSVRGAVQGVGFRPFVHLLAMDEQLAGAVWNEGRGVQIELQGPRRRVERFVHRLQSELRPPAHIDSLGSEALPVDPTLRHFVIDDSRGSGGRRMALVPDVATCPECLAELRDPTSRRHGYPFITCARCGPRFTITRGQPYDRVNTTLAGFPMCADCRAEYANPRDRRYHAEAFACPRCGPRAWLVREGERVHDEPVAGARAALAAGEIVAIKGVGGFHLAVNARDADAVARLRQAKRRARKPLAVMVRDLDTAALLAHLDDRARAALASPEAPIVLVPSRGLLPEGLAPGLTELGLFLPYSPLHHLLFDGELDALVMTSGNRTGEPISVENDEALRVLPADAFLLHDRPIAVACDDGVVRAGPERVVAIRRARGAVPRALEADFLPPRRVLALGAALKVTVATLSEGELVVGRHLGDLDNRRTEDAWREEIRRMLDFGQVRPTVVAHDLHPDLASTRLAQDELGELRRVAVQHHHAHMAAVMVEHGLPQDADVVGIILDGLGYGTDGSVWGGEVLTGGYASFERAGHLRAIPQPGGDRAAHEPGRMATSLLDALGRAEHPAWDPRIAQVCRVRAASPLTSSAGRLFDGVAALLGVAPAIQDYEGEAAMRIEALVDPTVTDAYPLPAGPRGALDTLALVSALLEDPAPPPVRAARFHNGLADGLARLALATGRDTVVLAGGSMVNHPLRLRLLAALRGARVLLPVALPPGDGAISAGQAAVAACQPS